MVIHPHRVEVRLEMRQRLLKLIEKDDGAAAINRARRHMPPKAQITHETGLLERWRLKPRLRVAQAQPQSPPARAPRHMRMPGGAWIT
jgi:hypothetical protein